MKWWKRETDWFISLFLFIITAVRPWDLIIDSEPGRSGWKRIVVILGIRAALQGEGQRSPAVTCGNRDQIAWIYSECSFWTFFSPQGAECLSKDLGLLASK